MIVIQNERVRRVLSFLLPCVLLPGTVLVSALLFRARQYALGILLMTLLSLLFFITGFEQKKNGSRRLVLISVLTVLSCIGRLIPFLKPVTALTILGGVWLGGESGFLIGALSALLSNFAFGQGPWTPFQMLAWGMIGLIAGLCAVPFRKHRLLLLIYGFLSGILFSALMDVWTVLWMEGHFSLPLYGAAFLSALPFTVLYAVSNLLFLLLFAGSFGKKMKRVSERYGI